MSPTSLEFRQGAFLSYAEHRFHRIAYTDWGDRHSARIVVCVHGLSRQGRDFDALASALAARGYRVVCPDLVGRGRSGRLDNPEHYDLPLYAHDMAMLIAHLGGGTIDWIGTSLGALVGMVLASARDTPIQRLIINDIGPFLPWGALRRIGNDLHAAPQSLPDMEAAEAYLRIIHAPFGRLTDAQWRHLAKHSFVPNPDGSLRPHYDPAIANAFRPGRIYNVSLWRYWDKIRCPVLVLRGERSDLLTRQTADEMANRGPHARLVEIANCGHAPALMDQQQLSLVTDWIRSNP